MSAKRNQMEKISGSDGGKAWAVLRKTIIQLETCSPLRSSQDGTTGCLIHISSFLEKATSRNWNSNCFPVFKEIMDETIKQIKAYFFQCTRINAVWFSDRTVMSVKGLVLWGWREEVALKHIQICKLQLCILILELHINLVPSLKSAVLLSTGSLSPTNFLALKKECLNNSLKNSTALNHPKQKYT